MVDINSNIILPKDASYSSMVSCHSAAIITTWSAALKMRSGLDLINRACCSLGYTSHPAGVILRCGMFNTDSRASISYAFVQDAYDTIADTLCSRRAQTVKKYVKQCYTDNNLLLERFN